MEETNLHWEHTHSCDLVFTTMLWIEYIWSGNRMSNGQLMCYVGMMHGSTEIIHWAMLAIIIINMLRSTACLIVGIELKARLQAQHQSSSPIWVFIVFAPNSYDIHWFTTLVFITCVDIILAVIIFLFQHYNNTDIIIIMLHAVVEVYWWGRRED